MKRAIIIMAKVPDAGFVKTRLHPVLSPEKCAELAAAFLRDAETKAKIVCRTTILAYAPAEKRELMKQFAAPETSLIHQTGANLGERMRNAFVFAFAQKSDAVVMIGTDSPNFPPEFIEQAFDFLKKNADLVLGKTEDGGFYLIGLRKNHSSLFQNIRWSSETVFQEMTRNAARLNLRLRLAPEWFDVDAPADLIRLREEMLEDENSRKIAPETFRWFKTNSKLFGKF